MYIYEICVLLSPSANEAIRQDIVSKTHKAVEDGGGNVLFTDEWGLKTLAQPTCRGENRGYYIYFLYLSDGAVNKEVERRFRINESVIKFVLLKKGESSEREELLKNYMTPYASNSAHHPPEADFVDRERKFSFRRGGDYSKIQDGDLDWKNPRSYGSFINDFGKISPARVTGLNAHQQRVITKMIKIARCMGLVSHISKAMAL